MSEMEKIFPHEDPQNDEYDFSRPFRARIIVDNRDDEKKVATGSLDGQLGWCLGMYEVPDITKKRPPEETRDFIELQPELGEEGEVLIYNPLIYTDSGVYIWGMDCYFMKDTGWMKNVPLEVAREAVELQKQRLRMTLGADVQISLN